MDNIIRVLFEKVWEYQQGAAMLKESSSHREWKKTIAEFFFQEGYAARQGEVDEFKRIYGIQTAAIIKHEEEVSSLQSQLDACKAELGRYKKLYQLAKSEDFKLACGPLTASIEFCERVAKDEIKRADKIQSQLDEVTKVKERYREALELFAQSYFDCLNCEGLVVKGLICEHHLDDKIKIAREALNGGGE